MVDICSIAADHLAAVNKWQGKIRSWLQELGGGLRQAGLNAQLNKARSGFSANDKSSGLLLSVAGGQWLALASFIASLVNKVPFTFSTGAYIARKNLEDPSHSYASAITDALDYPIQLPVPSHDYNQSARISLSKTARSSLSTKS